MDDVGEIVFRILEFPDARVVLDFLNHESVYFSSVPRYYLRIVQFTYK